VTSRPVILIRATALDSRHRFIVKFVAILSDGRALAGHPGVRISPPFAGSLNRQPDSLVKAPHSAQLDWPDQLFIKITVPLVEAHDVSSSMKTLCLKWVLIFIDSHDLAGCRDRSLEQ
jgi:hypothetical protein